MRAGIGAHVGQRNLAVTANTYSHVLTDEAELTYGKDAPGVNSSRAVNVAIGLSVAAAVGFAAVAWREWDWRHRHPYELGPSGYIVALGVAGALVCVVLGVLLHEIQDLRRQRDQALRDYLALRKRVAALDGQYVEPYDRM